jgi:hypothetical protein
LLPPLLLLPLLPLLLLPLFVLDTRRRYDLRSVRIVPRATKVRSAVSGSCAHVAQTGDREDAVDVAHRRQKELEIRTAHGPPCTSW